MEALINLSLKFSQNLGCENKMLQHDVLNNSYQLKQSKEQTLYCDSKNSIALEKNNVSEDVEGHSQKYKKQKVSGKDIILLQNRIEITGK